MDIAIGISKGLANSVVVAKVAKLPRGPHLSWWLCRGATAVPGKKTDRARLAWTGERRVP